MEETFPPTPSSPPTKDLQEYDIAQEYKHLISTLPKNQGWLFTNFYQYQGFWFESRTLQGTLRCQRYFHAQDSDLFLITSPKSGTTWLKAITYSIANRATTWITKDHDDQHPLHLSNPHDLIPFIELMYANNQKVFDLGAISSPRMLSTHLALVSLPKSVMQTRCKIVYLCRNPKDVCISYWHFTNKLRGEGKEKISLEEAVDKFCNGVTYCGPFWDHVLDYWRCSLEFPEKVFFLKYENLIAQPVLYLKKLADFIGCSFTEEEEKKGVIEDILKMCSIDNLSNLEVNKSGKSSHGHENNVFFRKGEVGDWINYMSQEMIKRFDKITEEKLRDSGLML